MSRHVFARVCNADLPVAVGGEGCYLFDASGKRYLDGSGGAAVSCLGHGHPVVREAVARQMDRVAFAHTGFFTSEPAESLADRLIANAPTGIDRAYFVSGGSEAMEAAIKLARQYFIEKGEPSRQHLIARRQSYHGNTLGALATGGNAWRREPFAPLLADTTHVSPCYAYRDQLDTETAEEYGQRLADELDAEIRSLGAENVMAFVAEPVVGATAGAVPPVEGYFRRVRDLCNAHGILLILDEIMCGMGRTGTLFACEQDGVAPDIVTIAKGLGAGYQPIGAMLCTAEIHDTIAKGSGFFQHGHTYLGHPVACAAADAVLQVLVDEQLPQRAAVMGKKLMERLHARFDEHPHVGDIRGRGLFIGLEFVADRETREPFDPGLRVAATLKRRAFESGLICYPMGGTVDGRQGDHLLLAPPFIIEDDQLDELVAIVAASLDASVPAVA